MAAVSSSDVWAVGSQGSRTLTEHWDGTRWSVVTSPNPLPTTKGNNFLTSVTTVSSGDVWAVGDEEWFARLSVDLGPFLVPAATGHDTYHGRCLPSRTKDFEAFKALNPVLKYRRP